MMRRIPGLAAAVIGLFASAAQAGEVWITMDESHAYALKKPVGSIVVANPAIADVQVLSATELLMFGNMPGFTNVTFFDREGRRLDEVRVRVGVSTRGQLTLQSGGTRYTFSCANRCEQTPTYGDGDLKDMTALIEQAETKAAAASRPRGAGVETVSVREDAASGEPQS
ncbi:pilus assembly protein N-terminal domain-containing protein [Parvularcula oceani]|uniref:pilus assembly protein N-terminal domain-containing protein n=1 Tax=Parvularcula oceani TaxID=1247963 RepID=UPI0004E0C149|nr:pilus assembly protein N-terminal domain-containing protein [Parvularcula oceani]